MTNVEKYRVLNQLTKDDILKSMKDLDERPEYKVGNNFYYEVFNPDNQSRYPIKELVEKALENVNVKFSDGFFDRLGLKDPVYKTLDRLGFKYAPKKRERIHLKLAKTQDLGNEIYIPKKYIGKESKFFPDPRLEDPNPIGDSPHSIKILLKWKGVDSDFKEYELKNFRNEFDANSDTRIAGTPNKKLNSIILFKKNENQKYEVELVNKDSEQYENLIKKLDNNSYMLIDELETDVKREYKTLQNKNPLNQILYGPPGTGKTYSTITKALNIIGLLEEKDSYTKKEYEKAQSLFQNELGNRIEFLTMHQSFSYEDFVQGLKPKKGEHGIEFAYKNGVFKEICGKANLLKKQSLYNSSEDRIDFEVVYNYSFKSLLEDNEPITIERGTTKFIIHEYSDSTLWFETSNGKRHPRYTLAKKTLKKIYDAKSNDIIKSGNKGYFDATLNFLLENEEKIKVEKKDSIPNENINHVIILDEINRANISRVFGELIALIEEDKRDGKLTATLPSGDSFAVPSNLYIIGTMNTADKSIALVDIALRRRFRFIPMYPDLPKLENVLKENGMSDEEVHLRIEVLSNLNRLIRSKKSVDFEIGHSYFMSSDKLDDIINDQVLPLLNEYFMYDLRVVKDLLEKQQYDKDKNKIPRIGIKFDPKEFINRGLLKISSVYSLKSADIIDTNTEIESAEEV